MKGSVCGNCRNFKPKKGRKFYNCTKAEHAGVKYGMQVRADTRACDAFVPAGVSPTGERAKPVGFWRRRRALLLPACLIAVLLVSWAIYSSATTPTETGTTPVSGNETTPTATPVPAVIVKDFEVGREHQAVSPTQMVTIVSAKRVASYQLLTGKIVGAPPGTVFVRISVACMNLGDTGLPISSHDFSLTDREGESYKPYEYNHYYVGKPYIDDTLLPGESAEGTVFWIVPKTASGLEISYLLDATSTPRVIARWKIT